MTPSETPAQHPELGTGRVLLRPRKAQPFYGRHPWVLASAVERIEGEPADGDVVELHSDKGKFIARGILNRQSRLAVRLYSWDPAEPLGADFWRARLRHAIALRRQLGYLDADGATRLVFSEADGLSGLVVDRYGGRLVVQINSRAMDARAELLADLLEQELHPQCIILQSDEGLCRFEGITPRQTVAHGEDPAGPIFVSEHGLRYGVDLLGGQKTGLYLDQRENRLRAARYFQGRRVLDMFCYTGGFGLAAAKLGGAREVLGIDSSAKAIMMAKANAELNGLAQVNFRTGEAFKTLDEFVAAGEKFDGVVLDPPKFTRNKKSLDDALRAYHRLNRVAVDILSPGGILVTCSCSGNVTREDFLAVLSGVSQKSRRDIQVLECHGPAPDHPVSTTCLETEYLKCFICRVT